jgi:hypothetical protein
MGEEKKCWTLFVLLIVAFGFVMLIKHADGEQFIFSSVFLVTLGLFGMAIVLYTISHTEYAYGHLMNIVTILTLAGSIFSALFSLYEIPFENIIQWKSLKVYYVLLVISFLRATFTEALLEWRDKYFEG